MHETVQLNLAVLLFLPWYAILGALFWLFPRKPRTLGRWLFDVASLAVATIATIASTHWSYLFADTSVDAMWPQILAVLAAYHVFPLVLAVAWLVRGRLISPVS